MFPPLRSIDGQCNAAYSTRCQQRQQRHHSHAGTMVAVITMHGIYQSAYSSSMGTTYTPPPQRLRSSYACVLCASSPREGCRGILACVKVRVCFVYMARTAKWLKSLKVQVVEGVPLTTRMFGRTHGLLGLFARGLGMFVLCVHAVLVYILVRNAAHTSGSGRSV